MGKLELQDLTFQYPGAPALTLDHLNLSVEEGEFVCILGASGCGKSTLLSILEGLRQPSSGRFLIDGQEVTGPGPERGVVFQHYSLFPWMTAKENVIFGIRQVQKKWKKKQLEEVARSYLEKVGLAGNENALPAQLSGGMQQRVAIARALAMNADILLLYMASLPSVVKTKPPYAYLVVLVLIGWVTRLNQAILPIVRIISPIPSLAYTTYVVAAMPNFRVSEIVIIFLGIF